MTEAAGTTPDWHTLLSMLNAGQDLYEQEGKTPKVRNLISKPGFKEVQDKIAIAKKEYPSVSVNKKVAELVRKEIEAAGTDPKKLKKAFKQIVWLNKEQLEELRLGTLPLKEEQIVNIVAKAVYKTYQDRSAGKSKHLEIFNAFKDSMIERKKTFAGTPPAPKKPH